MVEQLRKRLTSLRALAEWLFTEHKAYMAVDEPFVHQSGDLLDTY